MTTLAIIILIFLGIVFLLLEFFVVPGLTIAGIAGLCLLAGGVYLAYDSFGTQIGHYTLLSTILFVILSLFVSLRSGTWKKLMLNEEVASKIVTVEKDTIKAGDKGITISRLAPTGKVLINDKYAEAESLNDFIDPEEEIIVVKINRNKIIVKRKNI